jgi:hypothetical protein
MTSRLYFELEHYDRYHRADWEERLAGWLTGAAGAVERAARPADAEFIIEPAQAHSFIGGRVFGVAPQSHYHHRPEATFAWDQGDQPTGRLPGLYCSLSRRFADPKRHRGFCYPLRMNRLVRECPAEDAKHLFGFSGNVTSPLRARIFAQLRSSAQSGEALLRETESLFLRIYSPETDIERARYVEDLRQCRFILCPRGNGLSSIRLFETLEAGRVPVIISDALLLPACVNWSACAVVVPERDIGQIPAMLAARDGEWPRMARNARVEWERCFGDATLLPTIVGELRAILAARRRPESQQRYFFPFRALPAYTLVRAKAAARRLQALRLKFF